MTSLETIAVLIVSYRRPEVLRMCLESADRWLPKDAKVYVWDNHSTDSDRMHDLAADYPAVSWHFSQANIGFAAAVNRLAARAAPSNYLLLLNPDAELRAPITPLVEAMRDPRIAASGPSFPPVSGANSWDNARPLSNPLTAAVEAAGAGRLVRWWPVRSRYPSYRRDVGYVSGACLLIREAAWRKIGPFDERFWLYSEEMDWAKRARSAGWRVTQVSDQVVRHASGGTVSDDVLLVQSSKDHLSSSVRMYLRKYYGLAGLVAYEFTRRGLRGTFALLRMPRRLTRRPG
jgi:GT2 family glycosyltransferase